MKTLTEENILDIVTWLRSKASITDKASKILHGEVKTEKRVGNMVLLQFYDLPDPVQTTVRMETRLLAKDEKTTYGDLRSLDQAFFNEFANVDLPLKLNSIQINNIVPRQLVPELGTKDRKESLRDYLFYFV